VVAVQVGDEPGNRARLAVDDRRHRNRRSALVEASRDATLDAALQVASVMGLDGVTIGSLADDLGMSKSGLVGRFGSKQELQLATLERAANVFREVVYDPAAGAPAGLARLNAICDAWIAYLARPPFPGGCFMTTVSVEFDARDGPVADAVRACMRRWLHTLEHQARLAVDAGELHSDPADVAFTLNALAVGANCDFQLHRDERSLRRARAAMANVLAAA
jgi:AcrR family transcriptional regulator